MNERSPSAVSLAGSPAEGAIDPQRLRDPLDSMKRFQAGAKLKYAAYPLDTGRRLWLEGWLGVHGVQGKAGARFTDKGRPSHVCMRGNE